MFTAERTSEKTPPGSPDSRPVRQSAEMLSRLESRMGALLFGAMESLSRSCLYFTRENLRAIGGAPDPRCGEEELEAAYRSAWLHLDQVPEASPRLRRLQGSLDDLSALLAAARTAAQLFGLLRDARASSSAFAPLRRMADPILRQLQNTGIALVGGAPTSAQAAADAYRESAYAANEVGEMLPALAAFLPELTFRMVRAALTALEVMAVSAARIAGRYAAAAV